MNDKDENVPEERQIIEGPTHYASESNLAFTVEGLGAVSVVQDRVTCELVHFASLRLRGDGRLVDDGRLVEFDYTYQPNGVPTISGNLKILS